jgi:hypothetical protein
MDAHFNEYLAAVAGMQGMYGEPCDGRPTEFHDDSVPATATAVDVGACAGSHWDV